MFSPDQYELIDFGNGRRLERFGERIVDRPAAVAANWPRERADAWNAADFRFDDGAWFPGESSDSPWTVAHGALRFELRRAASGQVGLFTEQAANWDWIAGAVKRCGSPPRILNLFAYTGGSTLAVAAAGGTVVHVDAARSAVAWARRNAAISGLDSAPIRWICEDAPRFVRRERKRQIRYDAVIMDPPTYGHGPAGEPWKLADDLPRLLDDLRSIMDERHGFVLLSCHTTGLTEKDLAGMLRNAFPFAPARAIHTEPLGLRTASGRVLDSGLAARFAWKQ